MCLKNFQWKKPKIHPDKMPEPSELYDVRVTADAAPYQAHTPFHPDLWTRWCLSNSSLPKTEIRHFPAENHGLRLGCVDTHPSCFTLLQTAPVHAEEGHSLMMPPEPYHLQKADVDVENKVAEIEYIWFWWWTRMCVKCRKVAPGILV